MLSPKQRTPITLAAPFVFLRDHGVGHGATRRGDSSNRGHTERSSLAERILKPKEPQEPEQPKTPPETKSPETVTPPEVTPTPQPATYKRVTIETPVDWRYWGDF